MSSLLDSFIQDAKSKDVTMDIGGNFITKLASYKTVASTNYVKFGRSLNDSIAKMAMSDNLNDNQIQRVVEECNNHVYLAKFAELKNSPDKEIVFDMASLNQIKEIIEGIKNPSTEKTASVSDENSDVSFLNAKHMYPALGTEKMETITEMQEKIASQKLKVVENEIEQLTTKFDRHIYKIAEAIITYDRVSQNGPQVFSHISKVASLDYSYQHAIKKAVDAKIQEHKFNGRFGNDYQLKLATVDIAKKENTKSLGIYSLMEKIASDFGTVIVGSNKPVDVDSLISVAKELKLNKGSLDNLTSQKIKLEGITSKARG